MCRGTGRSCCPTRANDSRLPLRPRPMGPEQKRTPALRPASGWRTVSAHAPRSPSPADRRHPLARAERLRAPIRNAARWQMVICRHRAAGQSTRRPITKPMIARINATKKTILAAPAALAARPPNPSTAAIRATMKKMTAQLNMVTSVVIPLCTGHAVESPFRFGRFTVHLCAWALTVRDRHARWIPRGLCSRPIGGAAGAPRSLVRRPLALVEHAIGVLVHAAYGCLARRRHHRLVARWRR